MRKKPTSLVLVVYVWAGLSMPGTDNGRWDHRAGRVFDRPLNASHAGLRTEQQRQ